MKTLNVKSPISSKPPGASALGTVITKCREGKTSTPIPISFEKKTSLRESERKIRGSTLGAEEPKEAVTEDLVHPCASNAALAREKQVEASFSESNSVLSQNKTSETSVAADGDTASKTIETLRDKIVELQGALCSKYTESMASRAGGPESDDGMQLREENFALKKKLETTQLLHEFFFRTHANSSFLK